MGFEQCDHFFAFLDRNVRLFGNDQPGRFPEFFRELRILIGVRAGRIHRDTRPQRQKKNESRDNSNSKSHVTYVALEIASIATPKISFPALLFS
jgi:hypothetical protein